MFGIEKVIEAQKVLTENQEVLNIEQKEMSNKMDKLIQQFSELLLSTHGNGHKTELIPAIQQTKEVSLFEAVAELQQVNLVKSERTSEEKKAWADKMVAARRAKRIVKPEKKELVEKITD
jgi:hypothetical protein